jgi:hypothetical protein
MWGEVLCGGNLIRASEAGEGGGEGVNPLNPEIHVL